eukprot:gene14688-biopygen11750
MGLSTSPNSVEVLTPERVRPADSPSTPPRWVGQFGIQPLASGDLAALAASLVAVAASWRPRPFLAPSAASAAYLLPAFGRLWRPPFGGVADHRRRPCAAVAAAAAAGARVAAVRTHSTYSKKIFRAPEAKLSALIHCLPW